MFKRNVFNNNFYILKIFDVNLYYNILFLTWSRLY